MAADKRKKPDDLDERTLKFASDVVTFTGSLSRTPANSVFTHQVIRSAPSIGATYIEASEPLGKKDFGLRMRICRKEAKETVYWLSLIQAGNGVAAETKKALVCEATELMKIFGAIVTKIDLRTPGA